MTLTPEGYRQRLVEKEVSESLRVAGAVSIVGPKSCGKTWCARNFANSEYSLVDPEDNFINFRMAYEDPSIALEGDEPHFIDEWQDVPKIWDAVRFTVDKESRKGRYLMCGSSTVDKGKISHSGAARIMDVRMHTMSLFESGDSDGKISLMSLFNDSFKSVRGRSHTIEGLADLIIRGGWPSLLDSDGGSANRFLRDYMDKICEVDAQKTDGKKRNVMNLKRLLRSLARNESTMAAKKKLATDIMEFEDERIDEETVSDYLDVFSRLFLIDDQPAYSPRYRSSVRVGKKPKRHLADPSLAAAALDLDRRSLLSDLKTFGFLFESLCERDLRIYSSVLGGSLYHYHDHSGREIDAVVELKGYGWGAFEIKLGQGAVDEAADSLKKIYRFIETDGDVIPPTFLCVITGTGGFAYRRDDGVYVVPIGMLRP